MSDWKQAHANEAGRFAAHQLVDDVLSEYAMNMGFKREGLPEYGLQKIVRYVAQVVLARAKGFEPELLSMSGNELSEYQRQLIKTFERAGKPVVVIAVQKAKETP